MSQAQIEHRPNRPLKRVQRDPGVCNNCYRRYRDHYDDEYVYLPDKDEIRHVRRSIEPIFSGESRSTESATTIPKEPVSHGLGTICECGQPSGIQIRPLKKRMLAEYGENVLERLEEIEIPIDGEAFRERLMDLKSDPDEQFADDRIIMKAIETARKDAPSAGGRHRSSSPYRSTDRR